MVDKEKILTIMQEKGPILPKDLMKDLGANTILIGAALSELAAQKKIAISHMKIGGSPIYYLKEHKDKLQEFSEHLNEKDQRTYELLKERRILSDTEQTPLVRVSLRNIKDFAKPLEATTPNRKKIFWKWYMLSPEETEKKIRDVLVPETNLTSPSHSPLNTSPPTPTIPLKTQQTQQSNIEIQKSSLIPKQEQELVNKLSQPKIIIQKKLTKKEQPRMEKFTEEQKPLKKPIEQELEKEQALELVEPDDKLHKKTKGFFKTKNILIKEINIIRKNKEIDYIVQIPSPVGGIEYYCKVKEKKRANDGDIASAFVQAQAKKLPILYIATGDLTKKAKSMLEKEFQHVKLANLG